MCRPQPFEFAMLPLLPLLSALANDAAAACPVTTSQKELERDMAMAERAYGDLDLDGFMTATDALRTDLPCLGEAVRRDVAARVHRVEGLRAHLDQDANAARQSFAAARAIEPGYTFPESLVPPGYPELELYEAIPLSAGGVQKVDPVIDGFILFDGKPGTERPTAWPSIVQIVDENGDLVVTAYLRPGHAMPPYSREAQVAAQERASQPRPEDFAEEDLFADEEQPGPPVPPTSARVPPSRATPSRSTATRTTSAPAARTPPTRSAAAVPNKKKPVGLLSFSVISAVTSGVSYGIALNAATTYRDPNTSLEELDPLRTQANLWSGVSAGTALLALGTGIAVGVRW